MMDRLTIEAAEAAVHPGFPEGRSGAHRRTGRGAAGSRWIVRASSKRSVAAPAATEIQIAQRQRPARADLEGPQSRVRRDGPRVAELLRAGRRDSADEAVGGAAPGSARSKQRSGLRIGNVFHAGDGNLHPLICYDEQIPGQGELAENVAAEILTYCIEAGGSITGEHGVGADKSAVPGEDVFATRIWTRCSCCGARSIPPASAIPARCSPLRDCAVKCRARIASTPPNGGPRGTILMARPEQR